MQAERKIQGGEGYTLEVLCTGAPAGRADPLTYAVGVNGDDSMNRWPALCRMCGNLANYRKR